MPKVSTIISYEQEEFGNSEVLTYSKELEDLDIQSWLWYLTKITEMAGYDCAQLQLITSLDKVYKTDW